MITCRSRLAALLLLALPACDSATGGGFLADGGLERSAEPLTRATLARGAVSLAAPEGYCIDRSGLTQRFAALARCDTLGGTAPLSDQPLALVTVSLLRAPDDAAPSLTLPAEAEVLERQQNGALTLVRIRTMALQDGFSNVSWRGVGRVGEHAVGLALYGPEGGRALGDPGVRILADVMAGLTPSAPPPSPDAATAAAPRGSENDLLSALAGLFD